MVEKAANDLGPYYVEPKDVLNTKISDLIGTRLIKKRGETEREREDSNLFEEVTTDFLADTKFTGLFFSAGWCAPCEIMLQSLKNFYTDANLDKRQFEVILVSNDRKKEDYMEHYKKMTWLSIPYGDKKIQELGEHFGIIGIPALIILESKTGFVI